MTGVLIGEERARHAQKGGHVRTPGEGGRLQAEAKGLRRNPPRRHPGLRLPAARAGRKQTSVGSGPACGIWLWPPQPSPTPGKTFRKQARSPRPGSRARLPVQHRHHSSECWPEGQASPPLREDVGSLLLKAGDSGSAGSTCPVQELPLSSTMPNRPFARWTVGKGLRG